MKLINHLIARAPSKYIFNGVLWGEIVSFKKPLTRWAIPLFKIYWGSEKKRGKKRGGMERERMKEGKNGRGNSNKDEEEGKWGIM